MKKKGLFFLSIALLFSFPLSAIASQRTAQKHVLDNGMTVLIQEMPASSVVAVYALVKTGSATEGKYLGSGISHFVEHMLFKGTQKRAVGEISKEVRALGGIINASTSFDYTTYYIELPQGLFDEALDIIVDMLMNSTFDPKEVEKERDVIIGEIRLHNDNPDRKLSQLVFANVYQRHPYRHPIIGYLPLFKKITRQDLLDYYGSSYIPNNIIFSVAGPVDISDVFPKIEKTFEGFQPNPYKARNIPNEPQQIYSRIVEQEYPTQLTRLSLAYQGVSVLNKDMYALDVLSMILGQGASSRLYLDVYKKKKLVHSIVTGNYTPMDKGLFEIACLLEETNVASTIDAIKNQINLVQQKGVTPKELEKARRRVLSQHIFANQTSAHMAYDMAISEAFVGDYDFSRKYVEAVKSVTRKDIKRVAKRYLNERDLTIVILKPKHQVAGIKEDTKERSFPEIKKFSFKNGLTVLLREDHTFPLVTMRLAINGGTRQEPGSLNGISEMISRLWIKGTKGRSANVISESVESLGASISGFSGRNSFGLSLNLLSGDFDFAINLLEDLIKSPTFPKDEMIKEKEQMKAALKAREDSISQKTSKALRETLFLTHPFRLDKLGTFESIERIRQQDILDFYQKFSVPNNMVLSIFGDFESDKLLDSLRKKLGKLKSSVVSLKEHKESPPVKVRENTINMDKQQAMVMIGFQGPKLQDQDRYGLEILTSVLGSALSGRMFTKIRDELGQAYTLGGSYTPGIDNGFVYFYVLTTDENVHEVKDILIGQIKELQINEIPDKELKETKAYLQGTFRMGIETNASLAFLATLDELYGLGFDRYKFYEESIEKVTKSDLTRIAREYFDISKAAIVLNRPSVKDQKTKGSLSPGFNQHSSFGK